MVFWYFTQQTFGTLYKPKKNGWYIGYKYDKFANKGLRQTINNDKKRVNILDNIKYIIYVFFNQNKNSLNGKNI